MDEKRMSNETPNPTGAEDGPGAESGVVKELPDELKAEKAEALQDVDHAYAVVAELAVAVRDLEDIQFTHSHLYNHAEELFEDSQSILDYAATAPESEREECLRFVDNHLALVFWPLVHGGEALESRRTQLPEAAEEILAEHPAALASDKGGMEGKPE
jgi:hypothetical protein